MRRPRPIVKQPIGMDPPNWNWIGQKWRWAAWKVHFAVAEGAKNVQAMIHFEYYDGGVIEVEWMKWKKKRKN